MGSATTVASRDIRQQSVGVAVKHHAPTSAHLTSRQHQGRISTKKIKKKSPVLIYVECSELFIKCFGKGVSVW